MCSTCTYANLLAKQQENIGKTGNGNEKEEEISRETSDISLTPLETT